VVVGCSLVVSLAWIVIDWSFALAVEVPHSRR
jgi:hypothetical protein